MAVWLARHGEDLAASERRFGDLALSAHGRGQARALAAQLAEIPFRACLVSNLKRAGETARLVLEGRDVPVEVVPDLAEGSVGDLAGLDHDTARKRHPEVFRLGRGVVSRMAATGDTAPGGEPRDVFLARAERAAARVRRELESGGELLVVSHGGLLNYMLQIVLAVPVRDEVPFGFEHCAVAALVPHGDAPGYGPHPMLRFGLTMAEGREE